MKTLIRRHLFVAALTLLSTIGQSWADYATTVTSFNPLAYWRLNETAASPALNKVANSGTVGSAGNGYAVSDATKGEPGALGVLGNSVRLINVGNVVGYCGSKIDVPFNAALNPKAPFSIEFWAKPNSLGADATGFAPISCFNPGWNGGASRIGWLFYLNNAGRWQFRLGLASGYAITLSATSGNAVAGTWQHIAATYDGATAKLYINGAQVGSGAVAAGWVPNTQMALRFGGSPLTGSKSDGPIISATGISGNRGYDGWLDEVAVFPSLLSASTIASHYSAATTNAAGYGAQILASSPVGYWNCNEAAVTPPDQATFPIAANSGSLNTTADGTNMWGSLSAQSGSGYAGFGADNKASFFDGENGYVALQDAPGLHFSGNITMMAWIKPQVKDFFRNIIGHGWDNTYKETFLRISRGDDGTQYSPGTNYYEVGASDGTIAGYNANVARVPIPDGDIGNWVFLAGTYDGSNWNLYRNGILVASTNSAVGAIDVTNQWAIGSRSGPSPTEATVDEFATEGLFFGGFIDEPAIFPTALAAADISNLYLAAQPSPVITRAPTAPATAFKGSSLSLSVWAEGAPTLTYSWTSNNIPLGVTTTNITINNLNTGTQVFAVIVSNPYGSITSSVSVAVVAAPPSITQQPKSTKRFVGGAAPTFSVGASGTTPLTYIWTRNGTSVQSGTSSNYTESVAIGTAGTYNIVCTVSNETGVAVASSPAVFTVSPVPSGFGGAVVASAPNAYYRLGESSGSVAYDYIGGLDGNYFSVTLGQPGYASIDPDTAILVGGTNKYMSSAVSVASGHHNFTIELWANGPANQADESALIANGNGSSGTTANEQFSIDVIGGTYRFFTRGGGNSLYTAIANVGPNGTWQHIVGVYDDTAGQMRIYVNGTEAGSGSTRPAGIRTPNALTSIGAKHLGNAPEFDGYFTGNLDEVAIYNSVAMDAATVSAHYGAAYGPSLAPIIDIQPKPTTNYAGLPATLSVTAHGTVPLSYQWKRAGVDILDATNASLTINPLTLADDANYTVAITNGVNPGALSSSAHITVLSAPTSPPSIAGLVLHLPFNGDLGDTSGHGNNGTGKHTTPGSTNSTSPSNTNPDFNFATDGVLGQALHYRTETTNGGSAPVVNAYFVTLGTPADLKFSSNVNFSVSMWVRFPANTFLGDLPFLCTAISSYGNQGFTFAPSYNLGGWSYSLNGNVQKYGPDHGLDDGVWHHLVHTFNRTGAAITYVDGVQVDSRSMITAGNLDNTNPVTIGQDPTGLYPEAGSYDIDDLGVWRKTLTSLEAASIYMAAKSNNLSFTVSPGPISIQKTGANQVTITWDSGAVLQGADVVTGPYLDVAGAVSPLTVTPSATKKFYRAKY